MHSTTTWLELAALTRAMADELSEPVDRRSILDIVTDYERWASYDVTGIGSRSMAGAHPYAARLVGIASKPIFNSDGVPDSAAKRRRPGRHRQSWQYASPLNENP